MDSRLIFTRIVRCLLLDPEAYEELRTTPADTLAAATVVLVASYLAGLGGLIWTFTAAEYADHLRFLVRSFLVGSALQFLLFLLWVGITSFILERVFRVPARFPELFRVMGFAFAPVALQIAIFIPALDQPIGIIALAATFYCCAYAVQVSTMATAGQAFCATLLGFAAFSLILGILGNGTTDLAPGLFALDPNSLSVGLTFPLNNPAH
jgi:hypothetical protein